MQGDLMLLYQPPSEKVAGKEAIQRAISEVRHRNESSLAPNFERDKSMINLLQRLNHRLTTYLNLKSATRVSTVDSCSCWGTICMKRSLKYRFSDISEEVI